MILPAQAARRVGRYLLCDQIGSGGMATIHLARLLGPKGFSRTVAVKRLHPQFGRDPQFVAMFLDEARLAVRVRHGNVMSPIDIVATDTELFIVLDYVNGESLAWLLDAADAPLPSGIAAAILVPVLLGLHAAHEATGEHGEPLGIVHRDVSPQNIMLGQDGVARVLDFGIAKAVSRAQTTEYGTLKGKLGYIAPEQVLLQGVDRRTDVFTAGVVLWECLTGQRLFDGDAVAASIGLVLHGEIAPPSRSNPAVTPELDAVVLRALARHREERFPNAISMADALQRATPLASALEVMQWVETLAGAELRRKAELVQRVEALDAEALYQLESSRIPSVFLDPRASQSSLGSSPAASEPTLVLPAAARKPAATPRKINRWGAFALTSALLTSAAAIAFVPQARDERGQPQPSRVSESSDSVGRSGAEASGASSPAAGALSAVAAPGPVVRPLPAPAAVESVLETAPSPIPPASPPAARAARSRAAAPARSREQAKPGVRRGDSRAGAATLPQGSRPECQPPWTFDERHVKVFKRECLP